MAAALHLAVRTVHVLAMAALVGGSLAAWLRARDGESLRPLVRFEWTFWVALGLLVATGVGNLGAIGAPGPTTVWGGTFLWKLGLVSLLVVGSAVRSLAVLHYDAHDGNSRRRRQFLARTYGGTAVLVVAVVLLAEVLAHG